MFYLFPLIYLILNFIYLIDDAESISSALNIFVFLAGENNLTEKNRQKFFIDTKHKTLH